MDFQYMPIHLCTHRSFFLNWPPHVHGATPRRTRLPGSSALALFEYVSGIFRSFAREDAGNAASGALKVTGVCVIHHGSFL